MIAEPTVPADRRATDAGFTLTEVVIVVFLLGLIMPVLAMAFTVVIRTTPSAEDRADDSRSLLNLTNWISQDVSSTSEDGFHIGPNESVPGGCLDSSLPALSINLLELHWREGTENYVTNYRFVSTGPTTGQIFRYACQQGQAANELRMTAELNKVSSGSFGVAPVEISESQTTLADGSLGIKGIQFVVLILDDYGVQRELLSLDATTTNVVTTLPGSTGGSAGSNTAPTATDLTMSITPPATQSGQLPATDADPGDVLFTTFPNGLPGSWNILATGVDIQVTPDPAAAPGDYLIDYRVTDPTGATADARLTVTISAVTANQPPIANAVSIPASKGVSSVATLVFSDPEGDPLTPVLGTVPADWTATVSGDKVTIMPSTSASGTTVIAYSVTDSQGATATSQITVNVCTIGLKSISPASVVVKNNGDLFDDVNVEITSNGACSALVLGYRPNSNPGPEAVVSFNASNVATIKKNSPSTWTQPATSTPRVVVLSVRQGANGPVELSINLTTTS